MEDRGAGKLANSIGRRGFFTVAGLDNLHDRSGRCGVVHSVVAARATTGADRLD